MKIVQLMLGRGYGGAERAFVDTCLALAESGHEVLAVVDSAFYGRGFLQGHAGITMASLRVRARWDPLARYQLRRQLQQFAPEVVHIHLRRGMALAAGTVKQLDLPLLASLHNYGNVKAFAKADRLLALTRGHKAYIEAHAGYSPSPNGESRVDVVPNFSRFPMAEVSIAADAPLRLLAYGRFVKKKGFDILLQAFADIRPMLPDIRLTLVGDGPEREKLAALLLSLDLSEAVSLSGWTDDVVALLDAHDVFVLPSLSEPFGIVLLEAMARGKGIVATTTEGPGEFLTEQECFFCSPGSVESLRDALLVACQEPDELRQRASAAHTLFKAEYQPTRVVEKLVAAYTKATGSVG